MKIPELLAPAGSKEALIAAVQNGADAVYLGGKLFSARQQADNFDRQQLVEAVDYAHVRGVKIYVTVNTLLSDRELPEAADYLRFLYESGVDAVIVQDLGVARIAHKLLPGLALHASTQMTIHNSGGVELLKDSGLSRVVLARELSLDEIKEIKQKTDMELEVFVHGALCICYSGQCLMSSLIGGRSGNRGRCAQPCRLEYNLIKENGDFLADPKQVGSHLLSPKDLNMIEHIPELSESEIGSLKIEGRMKRPEYVAVVTRLYRQALDRYKQAPEKYKVYPEELKELAQIFNRGFTTGYFFGKIGTAMMSYKRPNNRGIRLGRVTRVERKKNMVEILLEDTLHKGDGVEFWVTEGGRRGQIIRKILAEGKQVEEAVPGQKVWIQAEGKIYPGDRVFKTLDIKLLSKAEQSYKSSREQKKIPINVTVKAFKNKPLEIIINDGEGNTVSAKSDLIGQEAINKPLNSDYLKKQIDRLGNTPFTINEFQVSIDDGVMFPASEINETRRKAIEKLIKLRIQKGKPPNTVRLNFVERVEGLLHSDPPKSIANMPLLTVKVNRQIHLDSAIKNGADIIYYGSKTLLRRESEIFNELEQVLETCNDNGVSLVIATPRIVREKEQKHVEPLFKFAETYALPLLASNLGTLREALKYGLSEVFADFSLNIFNAQSLKWLQDRINIKQATLSPELTIQQIEILAKKSSIPLEAIVEGHLPLMVTEYCPQGSILSDSVNTGSSCGGICKTNGVVGLKDRLGLVFPIGNDEFCRNYIYNAKELSMIEDITAIYKAGITRFRIELSVESQLRADKIVRFWREELTRFNKEKRGYFPGSGIKDKIAAMSPFGLTKGHYYRGVE